MDGEEEEDEELAKQRLAQEIALIERELERKRLEEEIRRMEEMIASKKSMELEQQQEQDPDDYNNNPQHEHPRMAREDSTSMMDDGDMTASYDHSEFGIEEEGEIIEIEDDYVEEECEEEEYVDYEDDDYEEEIYVEDEEDDDEIIEEIVDDDGEDYEIEYVDEEVDDGYEDFGGHESFMVTGNDSFDVPEGAPNLFDALKSAATARNDRLEGSSGELHFQDYTPVISEQHQNKPPDAFDLSLAVSKKAQERDSRLAQGGEKKMTAVKPKSEYKQDFKTICLEAAELGRLTRLKEHIVEAEATEKTPEEEWKSKGLLAIQWRTQHMSVIHEAARAGAASKLPERVTSNYESEEEDGEYDESSATVKRVSQRMKELLHMSKQVGGGQEKIDKLIMGRKEENAHRTNQHDGPAKIVKSRVFYESADPSQVKLPRRKAPKVDPRKNLEKIQAKFKGTYREDLPLSNICNEVAERAWARRTRLDRPNALPRVQEICNCPYCIDPSPFQTFAYREIDKKRRVNGYESPDSEEERRQAREKRRAERRKNRPNRRRNADSGFASSSDSGMSFDGERPPRRGRQHRTNSEDSMSSTDMMSLGGELLTVHPPASATTRKEVASANLPPPNTAQTEKISEGAQSLSSGGRSGRIGAAAKALELQHQSEAAAESQQQQVSKPKQQPATKPKTRRVIRRRGVAPTDQPQPTTAPGRRQRKSGATPKKGVRRTRREGASSTTTTDGKTTTTTKTTGDGQGPATTRTKVITKPDGTRVVQRVVTRAPTKTVTRKVVVKGADGRKIVRKTSSAAADGGQAPRKAAPPGSGNVTVVTREDGARVTTKTTLTTGERKTPSGKRTGFWRKSKS